MNLNNGFPKTSGCSEFLAQISGKRSFGDWMTYLVGILYSTIFLLKFTFQFYFRLEVISENNTIIKKRLFQYNFERNR